MRFEYAVPVPHDETRRLEFKAVTSKNPVRAIAEICDVYAVAFLNSRGGRILWGIRDEDKAVVGVPLTAQQRDEVRRAVADKLNNIEPRIDPTRFKFVLHAVRKAPSGEERFVLSLTVPRIVRGGPFYASGRNAYVRLDGANKHLSGPELTAWIADRTDASQRTRPKHEPGQVDVFSHGDKLPLRHEIVFDLRNCGDSRPTISLDFHLADNVIGRRKIPFGIVASSFIARLADCSSTIAEPIELPFGRHLFTSEKMALNLLPGAWHRYVFTIEFQEHVVNRREDFAIRFFYEAGPKDVPFSLRILGVDPRRHA
jgi:hypothetical protein